MKKRKYLKLLMMLITVFSTASITVYIIGYSLMPQNSGGIYSDTLYKKIGESSAYTTVNAMDNRQPYSDKTTNSLQEVASSSPIGVSSENTKKITKNLSNINEVCVYNHKTKSVFVMPLEDYVASVVVAEMPASSPSQALMAQAVAVRTLAVNYIFDKNKDEHNGADICTDSGHCQAFADKFEFESKYGEKGTAVFENARNAANATKGLILLYENMPIVAAFHASSGDSTASSKEVWGGDLAYLVSVQTAEITDSDLKAQVINETTFTRSELLEKLSGAGFGGLEVYKDSPFHLWIGGKELTESGRVASIDIAGTKISGTKLRSILGLKSADFEISFTDDSVTFITKGYGHGVGMSQLGAVAMAKKGESFYSILSKYYPGTVIGIV